jgi:lipoate-protein ligase B
MSGGVGRQRIVRILRGNAMLSSSTGTTSTGTTTTSTLAAAPPPPVPYPLGWAWQTLLLHQRLRGKRRRREAAAAEQQENLLYNSSTSSSSGAGGVIVDTDDDDYDQLLVLEHEPVYTLGRGADIQHLTSLVVRQPQRQRQQPQPHNNSRTTMTTNSDDDDDDDPAVQRLRHCLTGRGAGTARLEAPSRTILDALLLIDNNDISVQNHVNKKGEEHDMTTTSMRTAMELLLQHSGTIPVLTPPTCDAIPIYRVERGGEVTYHGPGQLVVYPLLDLAATRKTTTATEVTPHGGIGSSTTTGDYYYRPDLHWFLREMEQLLIDTITIDFGVPSTRVHRDDRYTGVWIYDDDDDLGSGRGGNVNHHPKRKIAAIGLTASHWITSHGFSLNVHPNLTHFDHIRPCGITMEDDQYNHDNDQQRGQRRGVTSLLEELGSAQCPTMADVTECLLHNFAKRFHVQLVEEGTKLQ